MQMFTERGSSYVTMGLVPLAAHPTAQTSHSSVLARTLLAWLRAHGRRFYNFGGLETFKAKLQPDYWEPIYLLSAERKTSLRTLYAITEAFGGAPPLLFLSHALVRAAAQELRWIGERFTCR
jgi:phosphatidylglycerol lysyltransferase